MTDDQIHYAEQHLLQIANSFISEISEDNSILALGQNNEVNPEAVCNHHLIDLLSLLNTGVFMHYCESLFSWFADPQHGYSGHPFTLDSYTHFCSRNDDTRQLYYDHIVAKQLGDGSIPVYTAFVEGGDFFSTLWAVKILINYDKDAFADSIEKSLNYLLRKVGTTSRTLAQKGFLLYVLLKYDPERFRDAVESLTEEILAVAVNIDFSSGSAITHINDLYLLEDLLENYCWSKKAELLRIVEQKLTSLFQLDHDPELPSAFKRWSDTRPQQPYYQILLKSGVLLAKYLLATEHPCPVLELNSHLHGTYRKIKYLGLRTERELKKYKRHYSGIDSEFSRYEDSLKNMWEQSKSEYETSVFLMMPFKGDMEYRVLTEEIKKVCKENGFTAFRVDDPFRSPYDGLWDNIVANMLSCKYGISVYVSEKVLDAVEDEPRFFHNPNVAIEYGFMKSRGKKVLILKDKKSKTPSDIQGFIWRPFELKNPDKTVAPVLGPWLKEQLESNKTIDNDEE